MNSSPSSFSFLVVLFPICVIAFLIIIIIGIIQGIKQSKQKAEIERQIKEEVFRQQREEEKQRKKLLEEQRQHDLERERTKHRIDLNFIKFDEECVWGNLPEKEQDSRLDKAYEQRNLIKVEAYDTRYKMAKIQGTTYNHYLTSPSFCTCQDFRKRRLPCKHMYFLANKVIEDQLGFVELDYENGLLGLSSILVGRFPGGTDGAIRALQEHGCIVLDTGGVKRDISFAVLGQSKAIKRLEDLNGAGIPVIRYRDALKLFTSEIRHPELEDESE